MKEHKKSKSWWEKNSFEIHLVSTIINQPTFLRRCVYGWNVNDSVNERCLIDPFQENILDHVFCTMLCFKERDRDPAQYKWLSKPAFCRSHGGTRPKQNKKEIFVQLFVALNQTLAVWSKSVWQQRLSKSLLPRAEDNKVETSHRKVELEDIRPEYAQKKNPQMTVNVDVRVAVNNKDIRNQGVIACKKQQKRRSSCECWKSFNLKNPHDHCKTPPTNFH